MAVALCIALIRTASCNANWENVPYQQCFSVPEIAFARTAADGVLDREQTESRASIFHSVATWLKPSCLVEPRTSHPPTSIFWWFPKVLQVDPPPPTHTQKDHIPKKNRRGVTPDEQRDPNLPSWFQIKPTITSWLTRVCAQLHKCTRCSPLREKTNVKVLGE